MAGTAFAQVRNTGNHLKTGSDTILARKILNAHNDVRTRLHLPLLEWSDKLAASSQKWADTLVVQNRFGINPDTPYGQNLFMATGGSASPAAVVWNWASESRNYDHVSNTCSGIRGHCTQLVWKSTSKAVHRFGVYFPKHVVFLQPEVLSQGIMPDAGYLNTLHLSMSVIDFQREIKNAVAVSIKYLVRIQVVFSRADIFIFI